MLGLSKYIATVLGQALSIKVPYDVTMLNYKAKELSMDLDAINVWMVGVESRPSTENLAKHMTLFTIND